MLLTPYPPGIPLLIPGERFNRTIVQYLQFAREFNERFPGFETTSTAWPTKWARTARSATTSTA